MRKLLFSASLFIFFSVIAFAESIEISTYYPSPYGVYVELRSMRSAIGDTYHDPQLFTWDSGGTLDPATEFEANADLIVESNVGIGTTVPLGMLVIDGGNVGIGSNEPSGILVVNGGNVAIGTTEEPMGSLVVDGANVGIGTISPEASLDITLGGDGVPLLSLGPDAPWIFKQTGTGNNASLDLNAAGQNRYFNVTNNDDDAVAQFYAADDIEDSTVDFLSEYVSVNNPDGPAILYLRGGATAAGVPAMSPYYIRQVSSNSAAGADFTIEERYKPAPGATGTTTATLLALLDGMMGINAIPARATLHVFGDNSVANLMLQGADEDIVWPHNEGFIMGQINSGSGAFTSRIAVNSSGNVGIGTTDPIRIFSVNGESYFSGDVAIGTDNPTARLHVRSPDRQLRLTADVAGADVSLHINKTVPGSVGSSGPWHYATQGSGGHSFEVNSAGSVSGTQIMLVDEDGVTVNDDLIVDGDIEITGSGHVAIKPGGGVWQSSDVRLKNINGAYLKGLNEIMSLNPSVFTFKEGNPKNIPSENEYCGLIAQEVRTVFPDAVKEDKDGYLIMTYEPINIALINAIKELSGEVEQLRAEVERLKKK